MHAKHYFTATCLLLLTCLLQACGGPGRSLPSWDFRAKESAQAQAAPKELTAEGVAAIPGEVSSTQLDEPVLDNQARLTNRSSDIIERETLSTFTPDVRDPNQVKVAVLLPLSGPQSALGQDMFKAAQMALFDIAHDSFQLLPFDTEGTVEGARKAANQAVDADVDLVLGPVFANSVRAAKSVLQFQNINMIAFSTDWSVTSSSVFTMGFLPFDQIERLVEYALANNIQKVGVIAPDTTYGRAIVSAYQALAEQSGIETVDVLSYSVNSSNLAPDLRRFTQFDERIAAAEVLAREFQAEQDSPSSEKTLSKEIDRIKAEMDPPYDAVLIAAGGDTAIAISNLLSHFDLPPRLVRRMGTGLFDDEALAGEFAMRGAWFAAPALQSRAEFEKRFRSLYGNEPSRIASLAYDATALSAVLAQRGLRSIGRPDFNRSAITNPNGFAGIDGIFRFLENGTVERGLAVLTFNKDKIIELDRAPRTFERSAF